MRLRPRAAGEPAPVPAAPPPPALFLDPLATGSATIPGQPGAITSPPGQEKFKLRSGPARHPATSVSPPPFPLLAPSADPDPGRGPEALAPSVRARSRRGWLLAGLLVLGVGLFFALRPRLLPPPVATPPAPQIAKPAPAVAPVAASASGLSPPPPVAAAPAVAPQAGAVPAPSPAVSAPARVPDRVTAPPAPSVSSTVTPIAPGVAAAIDLEVSGNPSPAFRSFVVNAAIRGVIGGQSPKALINDKLVPRGEYADSAQGIVLADINAAEKTLRFRDPTGATVTRRY